VSLRNGFFTGPEPRLFAHRGASARAPENTLDAFRLAREQGVSYLELDVHLSSDSELAVIHDSSVSRTTGQRGRVENMSLAELRRLDAGFKFTTDHGRTFPYRGKGLRVPTLGEVLDAFPDMGLTVEIKPSRAEIAGALARCLDAHRAGHRVIVASHDHQLLSAFRAASPSVATSFSKAEVREFLVRLRGGSMDGYRPPGVAFQVPEYKGLRRVVSRPVIEAVHGFGCEVHVWTVNEPVHIARLLSWGVDGIMTDDPARAIANVADFRGLGTAVEGNHG
jgi:glycerophosphoryl diester phosphodiesterase